ncbi:MAG: hypothetical protein WCF65_07165, partial [Parachlamydiaceae bacterium]
MSSDMNVTSGPAGIDQAAETRTAKVLGAQIASKEGDLQTTETMANPLVSKKMAEKLPINERVRNAQKTETSSAFLPVEKIDAEAEQFQERSGGELQKDKLKELREKIKPGTSKEEIMALVQEAYKDDPTLVDQVFEFLLNTTTKDKDLQT